LTFFFLLSSAQVGFFLGTFFFSPPTPAQVSPAYLHLDYLPMHPGLLPPPPTYLLAHLPTHLPTFPSMYLPMYLRTKSPPRQWQCRLMKILQVNLISLLKWHPSTNVTVLTIPSLSFFTIIRFQTCAIPLPQLAKIIYKWINHHLPSEG
jgi:hypothetical protein